MSLQIPFYLCFLLYQKKNGNLWLVEAGAPVGLKLDSIRFLSGWLLLNGEVGMWIVGGDTEESGEIYRGGSRWWTSGGKCGSLYVGWYGRWQYCQYWICGVRPFPIGILGDELVYCVWLWGGDSVRSHDVRCRCICVTSPWGWGSWCRWKVLCQFNHIEWHLCHLFLLTRLLGNTPLVFRQNME